MSLIPGYLLSFAVGSDAEMTPRQEVRPVHYAFSLVPGARITGNGTLPVLNLLSTGGGIGLNISTAGSKGHGVRIVTAGSKSLGAYVSTEEADSDGIYAVTYGDSSRGMYARTYGAGSEGVYAHASGAGSAGMHAVSSQDIGVYGEGKEGAHFTSNQAGTWSDRRPVGVNMSTAYAYNPGIRIATTSDYSNGLEITTEGYMSEGVTIETDGNHSEGVDVETNGDYSAGLSATTSGDSSEGVHAHALGADSEAVYAQSLQANAIYARTDRTDNKYGVYTPDYIYAKGTQYPTADVAEFMSVREPITPGTVLVIGKDGRLAASTTAYDTRVAGIVSTDPGIFLGTKEEGNDGEALIAMAGVVPCNVDASYGAILPGDLLSTSPTAGHAMKAVPVEFAGREFYPDGTILGKALGSLEAGTGVIDVIVTLQ